MIGNKTPYLILSLYIVNFVFNEHGIDREKKTIQGDNVSCGVWLHKKCLGTQLNSLSVFLSVS